MNFTAAAEHQMGVARMAEAAELKLKSAVFVTC